MSINIERKGGAGQRDAWNRRRFLASATSVAVFNLLPREMVSGAQANSRVGIGMIGLGRQAIYANLPAFLHARDAQVVALCDVDAWRLDQGRKKVEEAYAKDSRAARGCFTCADFRELLSRPDVDAVMISTPDHWHVPMAMAAVKAGKDVCCEKPLTRSIAEGRELSDLVRQEKRVFRTDSEFRSLGKFHRACEWVRNGRIGQLQTIHTGVPETDVALPAQPEMPVPEELDYEGWLGPAPRAPYTEKRVHPRHDNRGRPGWMRVRDYCDGLITNWGAHLNDIAQWANNSDHTGPVEVKGTGEFAPADGLWNVLLKFRVEYRYANGVRLIYRSDKPYIRFEGTEGWIHVNYPNEVRTQPDSILRSPTTSNEAHLPFKDEKRDFLDAVKTRGPTVADAEVGHRTTAVCHLGLIAVEVRRNLTWDPAAERFTNCDEANKLVKPRFVREGWRL